MTRIAFDSNILVYLAGVSRTSADDVKVDRVRELIGRLSFVASLVAPARAVTANPGDRGETLVLFALPGFTEELLAQASNLALQLSPYDEKRQDDLLQFRKKGCQLADLLSIKNWRYHDR